MGMAGIMIEDQVAPKRCGHTKGKTVVGREEAYSRVRAACDARYAYPAVDSRGVGLRGVVIISVLGAAQKRCHYVSLSCRVVLARGSCAVVVAVVCC